MLWILTGATAALEPAIYEAALPALFKPSPHQRISLSVQVAYARTAAPMSHAMGRIHSPTSGRGSYFLYRRRRKMAGVGFTLFRPSETEEHPVPTYRPSHTVPRRGRRDRVGICQTRRARGRERQLCRPPHTSHHRAASSCPGTARAHRRQDLRARERRTPDPLESRWC